MITGSPFANQPATPAIDRVTYFAQTDSRGQRVKFGIKDSDRTRHMYVIGQTGMGKSTLLENMAVQDAQNGNGMCFIDPHGSAVDVLLDYIPEHRIKDVIYFAPFDINNPIAFNVMEDVGKDSRFLVAQGLMAAFKKIWGEDTITSRIESMTMNAMLALLEYPGSTLLSLTRIFTDKNYRKKVIDNVSDPMVKDYWLKQYGTWDERYQRDATAGVLNKLGQFASNPLIRNIIGQTEAGFNFRQVMDEGKILLVNLSKGQVGEDNASLLGSMLTTKIYLAALSRADLTKSQMEQAKPFYLYVDEFQSIANDSFAGILSEARKYKLALIMAHQYVEQMPETVAAAVFGNVGSKVTFRIGATDADHFEREYGGVFEASDLVSLGRFQIYLTLMIDKVGSKPFSANTMPPIERPARSFREEILAHSRNTYSRPRDAVEKEIADWLMNMTVPGEGEGNNENKKPQSKPWQNKNNNSKSNSGGQSKNNNHKKKPQNKKQDNKRDFKKNRKKEEVVPQSMIDDLPGEKDFKSALKDYIDQSSN